MQRTISLGLLLGATALCFAVRPVQAGVTVSYSSGSGNTTVTYTDTYPVAYNCPPPPGYPCYPANPGYTGYPAYPAPPTYYCTPYRPPSGYYLYIPSAAYTGWSNTPPVVVTSPPSMYGFRTTTTTVTSPVGSWSNQSTWTTSRGSSTKRSTQSSAKPSDTPAPSSPKDLLLVEKLQDRRIMLTWNAEDTSITSVVFYTGDIFQSPLESRRVSQPPFQSLMMMTGSVRYVGATVSYEDGTQTTQWQPYSTLSR